MVNKYRLSSKTYDRETPDEQIAPKKIYFISVEGVTTEVEYLQGVSDYRAELGIDSLVNIEVLRRKTKDGYSAPDQVIELLEEYLNLREAGKNIFADLPDEIKNDYSTDFIQLYLESPESISPKDRGKFEFALQKLGYDLAYRRHFTDHINDSDEFCILIDRDAGSHSSEELFLIIQYCEEQNYRCFISNPCFEFWLLLHFSDVLEEYSDRLDLIRENKKVSNTHTYVSYELSLKAHHGKKGIAFKEKYLPNIEEALIRASKFANDSESLITDIGCNIGMLIKDMQSFTSQ